MLFLAAIALAQAPYDPEIEALMRHRDEKRAAQTQQQVEKENEGKSLTSVMSTEQAQRLSTCLTLADGDPADGLTDAERWTREGGGALAAQCKGYAHGKAGRWADAASAFEAGAKLAGIEPAERARLWAQGGNAALAVGDATRALTDFDSALAERLPQTLATGEIHLDRARARVASGDNKGARQDLDMAVRLADADPLAWLLSATLARRMDDLALARQHIEKAASLARNDPSIALEQGVIYALSGDRDPAARAAFSRAAETAGKDSEIQGKATAYLAQLTPPN